MKNIILSSLTFSEIFIQPNKFLIILQGGEADGVFKRRKSVALLEI